MTGRRGRRRRKLLDDIKERRGYSNLKEEALGRSMWRARFGRGFGPVLRQTTKWMNDCLRISRSQWNFWEAPLNIWRKKAVPASERLCFSYYSTTDKEHKRNLILNKIRHPQNPVELNSELYFKLGRCYLISCSFLCNLFHLVVCLTTGPKPLPSELYT